MAFAAIMTFVRTYLNDSRKLAYLTKALRDHNVLFEKLQTRRCQGIRTNYI